MQTPAQISERLRAPSIVATGNAPVKYKHARAHQRAILLVLSSYLPGLPGPRLPVRVSRQPLLTVFPSAWRLYIRLARSGTRRGVSKSSGAGAAHSPALLLSTLPMRGCLDGEVKSYVSPPADRFLGPLRARFRAAFRDRFTASRTADVTNSRPSSLRAPIQVPACVDRRALRSGPQRAAACWHL